MGFFDFFSKDKKETLDKGLAKTKESVFSKITRAVAGKSKVDDEVLDNLEEVLVTSDVGVETTLKIIKRIEERVAKDKYINTEELNRILKEEIAALLTENNSVDAETFDTPEDQVPYVIMVVGVNGVGKTTTAINLSACLAEAGQHVMLVDFDPQGNASSGLGVEIEEHEHTVYDLMAEEAGLDECLVKNVQDNLDVLPSDMNLAGAEIEFQEIENKETLLKRYLDQVRDDYDFILIDCPPSLNILTINALTAADTVLVPIQCEYYALEGLNQVLKTVELVGKKLNPQLELEGVVFTMYDARTNLSLQVVESVKSNLNQTIYKTIIPRNVRLAEAPSHGKSINLYDTRSTGAESYRMLAAEVISRGEEL